MKNADLLQKLRTLPNEHLVARFQARDEGAVAAYSELVRRHQADLLRRCRARLGNGADAEEAVQETLLRAYRGLARFRGEACFRTWLYAIGDNQCNTLYARRSRHVLSEHLRALIELQEEVRTPFDAINRGGSIEQVREVLAGLPPRAREVLLLRFYRDLGLEEIAATLDIGLSAAKMRLYRAIGQFESRFLEATVGAA